MLPLNRISRAGNAPLTTLLTAFGAAIIFAGTSGGAWAHPLLPGTTVIPSGLLVGQAGTEADAEAAVAAGDPAKAISLYSSMIQATPKKNKLYLGRGIAYFKAKQYDKAAGDFGQFITLRPALIEGYLNRAYAYKELGKAGEGLADLAKVQSLDADKVDEKLRGDLYLVKKDYASAIGSYNKVGAKGGESGAIAFLLIGDAYAAQNDAANAITSYSKGIAGAPKNPYGYAQRGRLYVKDAKYAPAIKDLTQYIALSPGESYGYYLRGLANVSLKTPEGYAAAKSDLTRYLTLERDPVANLGGVKLLAVAQAQTGDVKGSIDSYGKIIAADKKNGDATFQRGMAYMTLKDYQNAIKDFQTYTTAFGGGPNAGDAAYNLGTAYLNTKDYEKAAPAYTAAVKANGKDTASYYGRLVAYYSLKEYEKAIPDADAVISTGDPKSDEVADAYLKQGSAYSELAKSKKDKSLGVKAIAAMKKYIALKPKDTANAQFYRDLVTLYSDPANLIIELTKMLTPPPTDAKAAADIYYNRGAAYASNKDYAKAVADFTKVTALTPNDKDVYITLAQTQFVASDIDGAIASYTKAIALNPDKAELVAARADLYIGKGDQASFAKADADLTAYEAKAGNKVEPLILLSHAQIKRALGKTDAAIALYLRHQAVEKDPVQLAQSTKELGGVYFFKPDYPNAIKTYTEFLKNNKDAGVLVNRATAYRLTKDVDKAMADANAALAVKPGNAAALTERGLINNKIGDNVGDADPDKAGAAWDAAIADSDKAIAANPKVALAYYCKGFAAYKNAGTLGKGDAKTYNPIALDALTKFLATTTPTDPLRKSAQDAIAGIKSGN